MIENNKNIPQKYVGNIDLAKDKDVTAHEVMNGLPMMYHVHFPVENPLPKILTITLNDRTLCSENADSEPFVRLTLEHTFFTSLSASNAPPQWSANTPQPVSRWDSSKPVVVQRTQRPSTAASTRAYTTQPSTTQKTTAATTIANISPNVDSQCGVPDFTPPKTTPLVFGGFFAMRKQFPW